MRVDDVLERRKRDDDVELPEVVGVLGADVTTEQIDPRPGRGRPVPVLGDVDADVRGTEPFDELLPEVAAAQIGRASCRERVWIPV